MSIFRKKATVNLDQVTAIRDRVKSMRAELGSSEVQLTDLFALISEDERRVHWSADQRLQD